MKDTLLGHQPKDPSGAFAMTTKENKEKEQMQKQETLIDGITAATEARPELEFQTPHTTMQQVGHVVARLTGMKQNLTNRGVTASGAIESALSLSMNCLAGVNTIVDKTTATGPSVAEGPTSPTPR